MFTSRVLTRAGTFAIILLLILTTVQPAYAAPFNDNFAAATQITALPYNVNADTTGATGEVGEPADCTSGFPLKTVWFAYTPAANVTLIAGLNYPEVLAVYIGNTVDGLQPITCSPWYFGPISFKAQAGVTYYFQVSDYYGNEGNVPFMLNVAPPPQVGISYSPGDPSIFDDVYFAANSYDPAQIYGNTYAWTVDGTTSDQQSFLHQFVADGDYPVSVTFTTYDGRSVSADAVVQVRTHDVVISKLSVPQTARVNQTKAINVDVKNKQYSENVRVNLYKGLSGGGEQLIGTLTLFVPARATRPTTFKFSYTFTATDAMVGKVTFRVESTIVDARDALPSDNNAIATTLVTK